MIRFIPRARASVLFDRLLWVATPIVAFLVGWVAVAFASSTNLAVLGRWSIAETPLLAALLGALVGALAVNVPLWLLDRYEPMDVEEENEQGMD